MDDSAFDSAYGLYGKRVLRYCLFRLGNPHDAEDAAAEVFARLIAADGAVRDSTMERWLITVASRLCTDIQRRAGREVAGAAQEQQAVPPHEPWLDAHVWEAVRRLTPAQQKVVFLRAVEDLPFNTIARLCRSTSPAIRMTWHRALASLRRSLEGADDGRS